MAQLSWVDKELVVRHKICYSVPQWKSPHRQFTDNSISHAVSQ
jgi:hypothetical protein